MARPNRSDHFRPAAARHHCPHPTIAAIQLPSGKSARGGPVTPSPASGDSVSAGRDRPLIRRYPLPRWQLVPPVARSAERTMLRPRQWSGAASFSLRRCAASSTASTLATRANTPVFDLLPGGIIAAVLQPAPFGESLAHPLASDQRSDHRNAAAADLLVGIIPGSAGRRCGWGGRGRRRSAGLASNRRNRRHRQNEE